MTIKIDGDIGSNDKYYYFTVISMIDRIVLSNIIFAFPFEIVALIIVSSSERTAITVVATCFDTITITGINCIATDYIDTFITDTNITLCCKVHVMNCNK